ncbi:hypothetical protein CEXT_88961 [Caerostris extrusa]|uniref:Uncharacterized protein n=1 Tax=Caerostris extrusa TaxID=172846 RepID=A0AAV4V519_CAEEX|nr:hypothetical protein CEXT_88961 [Caerostris extrusa]
MPTERCFRQATPSDIAKFSRSSEENLTAWDSRRKGPLTEFICQIFIPLGPLYRMESFFYSTWPCSWAKAKPRALSTRVVGDGDSLLCGMIRLLYHALRNRFPCRKDKHFVVTFFHSIQQNREIVACVTLGNIVIARLSTNDKCMRKNDYGKWGGMQVTRPLTPRLSSDPSVGESSLRPGFLVLKSPSSLLGFFESVPLCWSPDLSCM